MSGSKALRKLQIGAEATAGTFVATSTIWRGTGTLKDDRETVFVEEDIGYISGVNRVHVPKLAASLAMVETPATFEQLGHILQAGIKKVTGVQDGVGDGYLFDYTFPVTTKNTFQPYTIEGGDDEAVERMEYGFVTDFTLSGEAGAEWTMAADWFGRQITPDVSFTGSLSVPDVESILFGKSKLFIDEVSGTIGSTQKTNTFLSATLSAKTGLIPKFTGDGELYFTFVQTVPSEITLAVQFEHDGVSTAEKAAWRAKTARQIRILAEGESFDTAGTEYSKKTMIIDLAGKWESFDKIGEKDGNDIVEGLFRARYDPTAALFARILLVPALSALP